MSLPESETPVVANLDKVGAKTFWLVTVNNPTDQELAFIKTLETLCNYVCVGEEKAPTTGMHHVHIAAALKKHQRGSWWKDAARLPGANLKYTTAGLFKNFIKYVKKGGIFTEHGDPPGPAGSAGRAAREEALKEYRKLAEEGHFREIPEGEYRAHYKYYQNIRREYQQSQCEVDFKAYTEEVWATHRLRPWQKEIEAVLGGTPDPRIIHWVYDSVGGGGKTSFARYMMSNHPDEVQVVTPSRSQDLAHVIVPGKRMYIIDIPRTQGDFVAWSFIEELKNGFFMKSKYDSSMVFMRPPHVVIFANRPPPQSTETSGFSSDRVQMYVLE